MRISDWSQTCALPIYAFLMSASLAPRDTPNVEYGSAIYSSVRLTYGRTSARTRPNARGSAEHEAAALVCALPPPLVPAQRIHRLRRAHPRLRPIVHLSFPAPLHLSIIPPLFLPALFFSPPFFLLFLFFLF